MVAYYGQIKVAFFILHFSQGKQISTQLIAFPETHTSILDKPYVDPCFPLIIKEKRNKNEQGGD